MKSPNGIRARVVLAALVMAAPLPAISAEVTLTGWAFGQGVQVASNQYSGHAGGFTGTLTGAGAFDTNSFLTYCVELEEHFSFSGNAMTNYNVVTGDSYFGSDKAYRMGQLVSYTRANPSLVNSAFTSAAMQLAVWNLVYDGDASLSAGSFHDSSGLANYATGLLFDAAAFGAPTFSVYALQRRGSQDFLLAARLPPLGLEGGPVPIAEPPGLALLAMGLTLVSGIGVWGARRRRAAAAAP